MAAVGVGDLEGGATRGRGGVLTRVRGPQFDPFREIVEHGGRQSASRRHLVRLVAQRRHQQTFRGLARY